MVKGELNIASSFDLQVEDISGSCSRGLASCKSDTDVILPGIVGDLEAIVGGIGGHIQDLDAWIVTDVQGARQNAISFT